MKKAFMLIVLCSCTATLVLPQVSSGRQSGNSTCAIRELMNPMSWVVPGLEGASIKLADAKVQMEGVPDDTRMDVLEPRYPDGTVMLVLLCYK
jgi:hypothetical protein